MWTVLADIVVTIHLLWIVYLIGGAILGRKIRWVRDAHLASLGFSMLMQAMGWVCPLTHIEQYLRSLGGGGYSGPFIQHYIEELVYLSVSREAVFGVTVVVVLFSLYLYGESLRGLFRRRSSSLSG
ncbi:MAG: DUF2784 domain-containing protein [bacterium]